MATPSVAYRNRRKQWGRVFLTRDEVVELHTLQLDRFGGLDGIRDEGLLDSAMPQDAIYDLVIATAESRAEKPGITAAFRAHTVEL